MTISRKLLFDEKTIKSTGRDPRFGGLHVAERRRKGKKVGTKLKIMEQNKGALLYKVPIIFLFETILGLLSLPVLLRRKFLALAPLLSVLAPLRRAPVPLAPM